MADQPTLLGRAFRVALTLSLTLGPFGATGLALGAARLGVPIPPLPTFLVGAALTSAASLASSSRLPPAARGPLAVALPLLGLAATACAGAGLGVELFGSAGPPALVAVPSLALAALVVVRLGALAVALVAGSRTSTLAPVAVVMFTVGAGASAATTLARQRASAAADRRRTEHHGSLLAEGLTRREQTSRGDPVCTVKDHLLAASLRGGALKPRGQGLSHADVASAVLLETAEGSAGPALARIPTHWRPARSLPPWLTPALYPRQSSAPCLEDTPRWRELNAAVRRLQSASTVEAVDAAADRVRRAMTDLPPRTTERSPTTGVGLIANQACTCDEGCACRGHLRWIDVRRWAILGAVAAEGRGATRAAARQHLAHQLEARLRRHLDGGE